MNLDRHVKLTVVSTAAAAGSTDRNTTILDMAGFEGVTWHAAFGALTATAVTGIHAQQSSSTGGTFVDLSGTSVTITTGQTGKSIALGLYRPEKRYVRCVVDRATANAVLNSVLAIQYGMRKMTTGFADDTGTVVAHEVHISSSSGTA